MLFVRNICFVCQRNLICLDSCKAHLFTKAFRHKGKLKDKHFPKLLSYPLYNTGHELAQFSVRTFYTSQRRHVNPIIWMLLKPILKISAALTGRGVRVWYRKLEPYEKKSFWLAMKARWHLWTGLGLSLVGLFGFYYTSHIQETPITGRKRFIALTHNQLALISETEARNICEQFENKIYGPNDIKTLRVLDVMMRLVAANPELLDMKFDKWKIYVIKDDLINACVLPTGHVFVFDGMLKLASNQDQLAIVLGHEMAHALLEHGVEELSYAQLVDYLIIVFMAAIWCIIPSDGISIITQWFHKKVVHLFTHLPHSRNVEHEADKVGAMLAAKACYDIRNGSVLWKKMDSVQKIEKNDLLPEWMSTHPDNYKRAEFFDYILPQAETWRNSMQCPSWPNKDPRQAMEVLSKQIDNHMVAQKAGQDLRKVQVKTGLNFPPPKILQQTKLKDVEPAADRKKLLDHRSLNSNPKDS